MPEPPQPLALLEVGASAGLCLPHRYSYRYDDGTSLDPDDGAPAVVRGDLLTDLPALAPADATLVVFHSAVLAYVPADVRDWFVDLVTTCPGTG